LKLIGANFYGVVFWGYCACVAFPLPHSLCDNFDYHPPRSFFAGFFGPQSSYSPPPFFAINARIWWDCTFDGL